MSRPLPVRFALDTVGLFCLFCLFFFLRRFFPQDGRDGIEFRRARRLRQRGQQRQVEPEEQQDGGAGPVPRAAAGLLCEGRPYGRYLSGEGPPERAGRGQVRERRGGGGIMMMMLLAAALFFR